MRAPLDLFILTPLLERLRVLRASEDSSVGRNDIAEPLVVSAALDSMLGDENLLPQVEGLYRALPGNAECDVQGLDWEDRRRIVEEIKDAFSFGSLIALRAKGLGSFGARPAFRDPNAHPKPGTAAPKNDAQAKTWFEVRIVDEGGEPIDQLDVVLTTRSETRKLKTGQTGIARWEQVEGSVASVRVSSEAVVRDKLKPRRGKMERDKAPVGPSVERLTLDESGSSASLQSEAPSTIVVVLPLTRVRLIGMHFDTDKAFLRESAMKGIRSVVDVYRRAPRGKLLIVGHSDTKGNDQHNLDLSVERAEAVEAFLKDDVSAWEGWFGADKPKRKRWGNAEIEHMISALPCEQTVAGFQRFSNATRGTSLKVDGNAGTKTRRALIEAYMTLDRTTLPKGVGTAIHGCGEFFPEEQTGDAVEDPQNRRVEIYCFDDEIAPPVPGKKARKGEPEYALWKNQVTQDIDVETEPRLELRLRLTDPDHNPLPGGSCRILPDGPIHIADPEGFVELEVPLGTEQFDLEWEPTPERTFVQRVFLSPRLETESNEDCGRRLRHLGFVGADLVGLTESYQGFFGRERTGLIDDIREELVLWHDGGPRPPRKTAP